MAYELTAAALDVPGLSAAEQVILIRLAHHANGKTGRCFPSIATLMRESNYSRSTVKRAITSLKSRGILTARQRRYGAPLYTFRLSPQPNEGGFTSEPLTRKENPEKKRRELNRMIQTKAAPKATLPAHPLAELFPPMADDEFTRLVGSIRRNGLRTPITMLDGQILDGLNRYRACKELGIEPTFTEFDGGDDPVAFVLDTNLDRRHLNESQRAMIAAKLATLPHGGDRRSDQAANLPLDSQKRTAERLNVGERTVREAKKVLESAPEAEIKAIERGEKTVHGVAKDLKQPATLPPGGNDPEPQRCKLGHVIPEEIVPEWSEATDFAKQHMGEISRIKSAVDAGLRSEKRIFRKLSNTLVADLGAVYGSFKHILPYTVCTTCQGHKPARCMMCKGTGWLSQFAYEQIVPEETKRMWEKANA